MKIHIKQLIFSATWLITLATSYALAAPLNVWEIDMDFCNQTNRFYLETDAGKVEPLCVNIKNIGTNEWTIIIWFVDWEMSQWEQPTQACKTSWNGIFGQSVKLFWENTMSIRPWQVIQMTGELKVREWYAWSLYWCITATTVDKNADPWSMFSIISRKANLMTVVVSWVVASNLVVDEFLQVEKNSQGIYTVAVNLTNSWTSAEEIDWSLEIVQWLRFFKRILPIWNKTQIYPEETKEIRVEAGKLPRYGGKFTFTLKANNVPVDVTNKIVWPGWEFTRTYTIAYWIFKYGILSLIAVLIVLWWLWAATWKVVAWRRKIKKS